MLDPVLYLLYISDLPQPEGTTVSTFAGDTALMAVGGDVAEVTTKLQRAVDEINNWSRQWLIKLKEDETTHVNYTNEMCLSVPITLIYKISLFFSSRNEMSQFLCKLSC